MFAKFMNKKFFHPGSYPNEKQKWIKQQKHAANEKVEKEKQAVYQKEQESYQSRLLSAKTTEEKLKVDLNFMYDVPPGMQRNDGEDNKDEKDDDNGDKEKEVRFEWQKHAPRSKYVKDLGLDCQDQPFGVCVRNIRCFTCKAWGHQNTDRECPLYFANVNSEVNTKAKQAAEGDGASSSGLKSSGLEKCSLRLSDPLLLMNEMKEKHGLALKKSVIGKEIDPMVEMPDNEKILASDDEDTELGEADMRFVESLSNKQKRKLLKRLNRLERKEKQENNEGPVGRSKAPEQQQSSDDDAERSRKLRKLKRKRKRKGSGSDEELELEQRNKQKRKKKLPHRRRGSSSDSDSVNEYFGNDKSHQKNKSKQQKTIECEFYSKTGCCPLGLSCRDDHPPPEETSSTIMIENFFQYQRCEQMEEFYKAHARFYRRAYRELSAIGEITMFVCCCNDVRHLRGTVFVQFALHKHAIEAIDMLHRTCDLGQLRVELIPTLNWRLAICGLFAAGKCPQNEDCNFLHVIRNPEEMTLSASSEDTSKICSSYKRIGVCIDRESCERNHPLPENSTTLLVPNFFQHRKLKKNSNILDEKMYSAFKSFYKDFIKVFRSIGTVVTCKCSHDAARHLSGNFYVQFSSHRDALHARNTLMAQEVPAELVPEIDWSRVICQDIRGDERVCREGLKCKLLHVFKNPCDEYKKHKDSDDSYHKSSRSELKRSRTEEKGRRKRRRSQSLSSG